MNNKKPNNPKKEKLSDALRANLMRRKQAAKEKKDDSKKS